MTASELMNVIGLSHKPTFRKNYLHSALNYKFIEMKFPDKSNSSTQKYILTEEIQKASDNKHYKS